MDSLRLDFLPSAPPVLSVADAWDEDAEDDVDGLHMLSPPRRLDTCTPDYSDVDGDQSPETESVEDQPCISLSIAFNIDSSACDVNHVGDLNNCSFIGSQPREKLSSVSSEAKAELEYLGFSVETTQLSRDLYRHVILPSRSGMDIQLPEGMKTGDRIELLSKCEIACKSDQSPRVMYERQKSASLPNVTASNNDVNPIPCAAIHALDVDLADSGIFVSNDVIDECDSEATDLIPNSLAKTMSHNDVMQFFSEYTTEKEKIRMITMRSGEKQEYYLSEFQIINDDCPEVIIGSGALTVQKMRSIPGTSYQIVAGPSDPKTLIYVQYQPVDSNLSRPIKPCQNCKDYSWEEIRWTVIDVQTGEVLFLIAIRRPGTTQYVRLIQTDSDYIVQTDYNYEGSLVQPDSRILFQRQHIESLAATGTYRNINHKHVYLAGGLGFAFVALDATGITPSENQEFWINDYDASEYIKTTTNHDDKTRLNLCGLTSIFSRLKHK